jgi:hypothetical protein
MFTQNYNDAFADPEESKKFEKIQIPTRAVMNTKTLTIFTGDNYESQMMSFNIRDTEFLKQKGEMGCFLLRNSVNQKGEICPYPGAGEKKAFLEEWDYDFSLFKNQCNVKQDKFLDNEIPKDMKEQFEVKLVY